MHEAAKSEFEGMEKMKYLVEHGADVNILDKVSLNCRTKPFASRRKIRKKFEPAHAKRA